MRPGSPWQPVHPRFATSALPFRWPPSTRLSDPSVLSAVGWHVAHPAAVAGAATGTWPTGGMPWQEVQVRGFESVQIGVAFSPFTPWKSKLPWQ